MKGHRGQLVKFQVASLSDISQEPFEIHLYELKLDERTMNTILGVIWSKITEVTLSYLILVLRA